MTTPHTLTDAQLATLVTTSADLTATAKSATSQAAYLAKVVAAINGKAPTPPPTPPATGTLSFSTGSYLGDPPSATDMAGYDKFVGHPTVFQTVFGSRDSVDHLEHPDYLLQPVVAAGKIPCISFQGILSGGAENLGNVSTQTLHDRAVAFGTWLVGYGALGARAAIRMRTEANNTSAGDPATNVWDPSSVSQYAAAIAAIYAGLKSVPGQAFLCLADVAFDPGNNADLRIMLQAVNSSCDGYGLDDYDTVASWGSAYTNAAAEWTGRYNGVNGGVGYKAYLNLARANGKWVAVPEFGLGYFYGNNGAAQTPADDEGYFVSQVFAVLSDPTLKVALCDFWEDNNGLYKTGGQSLPLTTAVFKSTFGSLPSAPWPRAS